MNEFPDHPAGIVDLARRAATSLSRRLRQRKRRDTVIRLERRMLSEAEARIRHKHSLAIHRMDEIATRAKALGITFTDRLTPEFREAILDHYENPHAPTDVDYGPLTSVLPANGDWHGKAGRMIRKALREAHFRLMAWTDEQDGGNRVAHHLQFEEDKERLRPGEVCYIPASPHAPVRPRIMKASEFEKSVRSWSLADGFDL